VAVEAEPEAVAFVVEHGRRLYVWADGSGLKHVRTTPPDDSATSFEEVSAKGFRLFVATDIQKPKTWNVVFHHLPHRHVDVLWDGDQPGHAFLVN
jgi:hypothetical protein